MSSPVHIHNINVEPLESHGLF